MTTSGQQNSQDPLKFDKLLNELNFQQINPENRQRVIDNYLQLVEKFPDHPRVAHAMYKIARLHARHKDDTGNSRNEAIKWYRETANRASKGDRVWCNVQFALSRQLRQQKEDVTALNEARSILEMLSQESKNELLEMAHIAMKVEYDLIAQCLAEGNDLAAEQHCRALLNWDNRPEAASMDANSTSQLQTFQMLAASHLMDRMVVGPGTKAEKVRWLEDFFQECIQHEWLTPYVEVSRDRISKIQDTMGFAELTPNVSPFRRLLLICNLVAVVILSWFVVKKRILVR